MWKVSLTDSRISQQTENTQRIPAKYTTLKQAEAAGLNVPKSLLLDSENSEITQNMIEKFVNAVTSSRFIVRSAHLSEDGSDLSLAGHFWSSDPVVENDLAQTIQQALIENSLVLDSLQSTEYLAESPKPPKLILQEYIEHHIGGVLFSPWSYFSDYAYVEYSLNGVKEAVEGLDSSRSVLCLDSHFSDPLPLAETHSSLKQHLVSLCSKFCEVYDFPVDCEWAFDQNKQEITVLQVRPQTHLVGPILPYSRLKESESLSDVDHPQTGVVKLTPRLENWQFTALSESLGRLSPLSFSLLQQLYIDAIPLFQKMGCKAQNVDFMRLAPDGTVLIDPELEQRFFAMTLFGGFQRGIRQAKFASKTDSIFKRYDSTAPFSYQTLQQLFAYWMAANLLSAGQGRGSHEATDLNEPRHAYELSWPADIEVPFAQKNHRKAESFERLNVDGKVLFLFELNKLKRQLREQINAKSNQAKLNSDVSSQQIENQPKPGYLFFSTWQALQTQAMTPLNMKLAKDKQHELASQALYDFALVGASNGEEVQALSSTKSVTGQLLIIDNPAITRPKFLADCILIAPYFDNSWVNKIKLMNGIVVRRGGRLSHSAIVAREYGVPYYVVPELNLQALDQGKSIVLDPNTVTCL